MDVELAVNVVDVRLRGALGNAELILNERGVVSFCKKEHDFGFAPGKKVSVGNCLALRMEAPLRAAPFLSILRRLLGLLGHGSRLFRGSSSGIPLVQRGNVLLQLFRSLIDIHSFYRGNDDRLYLALTRR